MFEFEIMITGYTILVATTSTVICNYLTRKKLKKLNSDINRLKAALLNSEAEIEKLKMSNNIS